MTRDRVIVNQCWGCGRLCNWLWKRMTEAEPGDDQ